MKFARKSKAVAAEETSAVGESTDIGATDTDASGGATQAATGPHDAGDVDLEGDGVDRVDLGGMLIAPSQGLELRLQVEEKSGEVQSVLLAGPAGAVEVRAFAAQRNGDLWSDVRRQIAADTARRGGTATEQEGDFGTELLCQRTVKAEDGSTSQQPSRIIGINGPRWFLRATFLGRPALDAEVAAPWDAAIRNMVIRRGEGAMAPGDPLPITLPSTARKVD